MPTIINTKDDTVHEVNIGKPPTQRVRITTVSQDNPVPQSSPEEKPKDKPKDKDKDHPVHDEHPAHPHEPEPTPQTRRR